MLTLWARIWIWSIFAYCFLILLQWAPCHAVVATPLLIAFELLLCIYLESVHGMHPVPYHCFHYYLGVLINCSCLLVSFLIFIICGKYMQISSKFVKLVKHIYSASWLLFIFPSENFARYQSGFEIHLLRIRRDMRGA